MAARDRSRSQFQLVIESSRGPAPAGRRSLTVNLHGQRRDARCRSAALLARQSPRDDAHDRGERQRKDCDDDKGRWAFYLGVVFGAVRVVSSTQLELHRDFDDDVNRRAQTMGGREAPLADRLHGALVETRSEPLQHLDVAHRSISPHDNFQHDVADEITLPCFFGVIRFHFAQKPRRLDAAAGTEWTAARAASRSWSDAGAVAFADTGSRGRARAATCARSVAVVLRRGLLEHTDTVAHIGRRGNDRHDEGRQLFGVERRRFRLRRCRRRHDRLGRLPQRQRAVDCVMSFAKRLRRRRRLSQSAAAATAARSRRRHEDEATRLPMVQRRRGRREAQGGEEDCCRHDAGMERARQCQRHALRLRRPRARREDRKQSWCGCHSVRVQGKGAANPNGIRVRHRPVDAAKRGEHLLFGHPGRLRDLARRVHLDRLAGTHGEWLSGPHQSGKAGTNPSAHVAKGLPRTASRTAPVPEAFSADSRENFLDRSRRRRSRVCSCHDTLSP